MRKWEIVERSTNPVPWMTLKQSTSKYTQRMFSMRWLISFNKILYIRYFSPILRWISWEKRNCYLWRDHNCERDIMGPGKVHTWAACENRRLLCKTWEENIKPKLSIARSDRWGESVKGDHWKWNLRITLHRRMQSNLSWVQSRYLGLMV